MPLTMNIFLGKYLHDGQFLMQLDVLVAGK